MLEIFAVKGQTTEKIEFTDIKKQAESISKLVFLWDFSSVVVDPKKRTFIINGGREFILQEAEGLNFACFRRNRQSFGLNGEQKSEAEVSSYLIGFHGIIKSEKKEVYLQISADGKNWHWIDKR
jgi:hypothetical protein